MASPSSTGPYQTSPFIAPTVTEVGYLDVSTPGFQAGMGKLFGQTVAGRVEAHWIDDTGAVTQMTTGGVLNATRLISTFDATDFAEFRADDDFGIVFGGIRFVRITPDIPSSGFQLQAPLATGSPGFFGGNNLFVIGVPPGAGINRLFLNATPTLFPAGDNSMAFGATTERLSDGFFAGRLGIHDTTRFRAEFNASFNLVMTDAVGGIQATLFNDGDLVLGGSAPSTSERFRVIGTDNGSIGLYEVTSTGVVPGFMHSTTLSLSGTGAIVVDAVTGTVGGAVTSYVGYESIPTVSSTALAPSITGFVALPIISGTGATGATATNFQSLVISSASGNVDISVGFRHQTIESTTGFHNSAYGTFIEGETGVPTLSVGGHFTGLTAAIEVGTGTLAAPVVNGRWFNDGDLVLGATAPSGTERFRAVGFARIEDGWLMVERAATPVAPVATEGVIWLRNDVPNRLFFTDDAATDHPIQLSDAPTSSGVGPTAIGIVDTIIETLVVDVVGDAELTFTYELESTTAVVGRLITIKFFRDGAEIAAADQYEESITPVAGTKITSTVHTVDTGAAAGSRSYSVRMIATGPATASINERRLTVKV